MTKTGKNSETATTINGQEVNIEYLPYRRVEATPNTVGIHHSKHNDICLLLDMSE